MYLNAPISQNFSGQIMFKVLNPQSLYIKKYEFNEKTNKLKRK